MEYGHIHFEQEIRAFYYWRIEWMCKNYPGASHDFIKLNKHFDLK